MIDNEAVKQRLKKAVAEMETPDVLERVLKQPINSVEDCDDDDKPKKGGIIKRILSLFA